MNIKNIINNIKDFIKALSLVFIIFILPISLGILTPLFMFKDNFVNSLNTTQIQNIIDKSNELCENNNGVDYLELERYKFKVYCKNNMFINKYILYSGEIEENER